MGETIYLNLHTHTSHSDGAFTSGSLAHKLADAGVRFAALCDHDTVEGWAHFREVLDARGVPSLPGIELTARDGDRLVHLLAYGFDPEHPELVATLASMRHPRASDLHSVEGALRMVGARHAAAAPGDDLDIEGAITLVHKAGGLAFLAHPLVYQSDLEDLEPMLLRLKEQGLDGIEAFNDEFPPDQQAALRDLAYRHDLLVSAGTDYHGVSGTGSASLGIDMPLDDWQRFRAAMLTTPGMSAGAAETSPVEAGAPTSRRGHAGQAPRLGRRSFVLRVVLPALAALGLFVVALWGVILPSFEETLVERKRELIRELTNSAWSVLAAYEADERAGLLSREEAQAAAVGVVSELRYGEDRLDYFWIQDTTPTMVMHPYRPDLDGEDLSGFTDSRGVPIFVEFADVVDAGEQGYVDYVWQWFDDPERLEPKESYVKGFAPWDWVIGTGLYTDDVRTEIDRLERDLILAALGISAIIALLLAFVLQQSLRIERRREEGVERLRESSVRYHALVEATTEGSLLVIDGRLRYANPTFLQLLGYSPRQLEFLELDDVLPREQANEALWAVIASGEPDTPATEVRHEGVLKRSDGSLLECLLTLDEAAFGGQAAYILLARDVTVTAGAVRADASALGMSVGVFRALAARRGVFLELSPAGRQLLGMVEPGEGDQLALADCFAEPAEFGRVYRRLLEEGEIHDLVLTLEAPSGVRSVLLSAALVRDEEGEPAWIDGLLVDVSAVRDEVAGREVQQLRASLLFLHESIAGLGGEAIVVDMDTSLQDLATRMTERGATGALVRSPSGAVIGIVTDHDIRARVVAEAAGPHETVETVMTSPLIRVPASTPVYEALLQMERHRVRHLVVEDAARRIVSVVDRDALIRSPRYAPLVLLRDITRAGTAEEVSRRCERTASVAASLMDVSARPRHVTSTLTSIYDAATVRLIDLALADLGAAPAPFALLAFGSQGRAEVHLLSDQDSGLIYAPPDDDDDADADADELADYFQRLGARVCEGLADAGYPFCRGKVMANDPRWCRSLPDWTATYDGWLRRAEPQDVTDLSVFLDFRLVYGEASLVGELRRHVHATLPEQRGVQYQLVRNALTFRPPLRLPGNIYLGGASESSGRIDLKDALQPIVALARVYAERHRIPLTHTIDRIAALADRELLPEGSREEISDAYDFLMGLRLETQLADISAGRPGTSVVEMAALTHTQRELLRVAFDRIAEVQKTAEREFPEA